MKIQYIILFTLLACSNAEREIDTQKVELEIRGADLSFLPEIEAHGVIYRDASGQPIDVIKYLKSKGFNTIRIRLWHTPAGPHSGFNEVIEFAERVRAAGLLVWLTVHYSDTWADPGNQIKPAAWSNLTITELGDSVYAYTKKIVEKVRPDLIQIGNEINGGFLWPEGTRAQEANFVNLLKKGVQAVRDVDASTEVMIHYAGVDNTEEFYNILQTHNISYNIIGLSYYPIWHGKDLTKLTTTINTLGSTFNKKIVIAETAYPFTLGWNDLTHNIVGESGQLIAGIPATPEGQHQFLSHLHSIVAHTKHGSGLCYWAPEWTAFKGSNSTAGSSWENMALFDFDNKALPAIEMFN